MDPQQVLANYEGGINLGTTFQPNIQDEPRGSTFADPEKEDGLICRESEHFRVCWFDYNDTDNVMDERVPDQLDKAEKLYKLYNRKMAMMPPIVSSKAENRGDGKRYKIEIATNWDGGFFGGNIPAGFGYPIQSPGILSAHELTHAYQMHFLGSNPGPWWEVHANWVPSRNNDPHVNPAGVSMATAPLYPGHGRNYYHSYLIYHHLANQDEYGERFIARLWEENPDSDTFHWNTARELDPDPSTPILDEWARMAQKNITWDYQRQGDYKAEGNQKKRLGWVTLKPIPYEEGWYRVPKEMAPMQFGWNICPLKPSGDQVSVELSGYINPDRGSDWRAGLVAVDEQGNPRYGEIFGQETATFTMEHDEEQLYLVVVGTPEKLMTLETIHDNRDAAAERFIYKVKLEGAQPLDYAKPGESVLSGSEHPNGGGFVARSATVDASVWVGPNAQVLNAAKVRGHARIEGHAVVKSDAVVKDRALVSGHAIVQGRVEGDAMVGDYAVIPRGTTVKDHAKVFEHAQPAENITLSGHAVAKGFAAVLNNISGTAICDASYAKTNELDKGVWLTWSWGSGNNAGDLDEELNGLYAEHLFKEQHPFYAWDTYGVTHGLKVGNPSITSTSEGMALELNGTDQFVELQDDIGRMADVTIEMTLKWQGSTNQQKILEFTDNQNKRAYLTPSDEEGKLAFVIQTGEQQNTLQYDQPLSQDEWVHLQLIVHGNTAALYLDGEQVAQNQYFTLDLRDVSPTTGYLGRGKDGNYFQGLVESVSFYSTPLIEQEQTEQVTSSENADLANAHDLTIRTSPDSRRIHIASTPDNPIHNIHIMDYMGRSLVRKNHLDHHAKQIQLNTSTEGIYIVVVDCEKGTYTRKVLM